MARNDKSEESCGNGGAVESVESQKQASPVLHSPLEISPRTGEIPTFPQLRRRGRMEKWKTARPAKAGVLSGRQSHRGNGQKPRSLDSRKEGN